MSVDVDLTETVAISDAFVTGLGKMEYASRTCMRFYFYADQDGERILAAKLVVPIDCIAEISRDRIRMMHELRANDALAMLGCGGLAK